MPRLITGSSVSVCMPTAAGSIAGRSGTSAAGTGSLNRRQRESGYRATIATVAARNVDSSGLRNAKINWPKPRIVPRIRTSGHP
ncbi:hypothetical protein QF002_009316 [Paraburkholderia youngii]